MEGYYGFYGSFFRAIKTEDSVSRSDYIFAFCICIRYELESL